MVKWVQKRRTTSTCSNAPNWIGASLEKKKTFGVSSNRTWELGAKSIRLINVATPSSRHHLEPPDTSGHHHRRSHTATHAIFTQKEILSGHVGKRPLPIRDAGSDVTQPYSDQAAAGYLYTRLQQPPPPRLWIYTYTQASSSSRTSESDTIPLHASYRTNNQHKAIGIDGKPKSVGSIRIILCKQRIIYSLFFLSV